MKAIFKTTSRQILLCVLALLLTSCSLITACTATPLNGNQTPSASPQNEHNDNTGEALRNTLVYYAADSGHMIPVIKFIPWEEGIGKAALACMIATDANTEEANARGLKPLIPDGTKFELTIGEEKNATLNIINLPALDNADTEKALLAGIVNTLVAFPTINTVTILLDGKKVHALPLGTPLSDNMTQVAVNTGGGDTAVFSGDSATFITVYFPNKTCSLQIPVTIFTDGNASFEDAVGIMLNGTDDTALKNCIPQGTALISASIAEGVASVNFSSAFSQITENTSGVLEAFYNSLYFTALGFSDLTDLRIYVEGELLMANGINASLPMYPNVF